MRGPRVVAIGGGHGLSATLRAARRYAGEVTGVVSVADDGGSTGRLRRAGLGVVPGDLRKCLVALAPEGSLLARALEHRFERASDDLAGHAAGNLLIAALVEESGDLVVAVEEVGRALGVVGRILPAATAPLILIGELGGGSVRGQVAVNHTVGIERVRFDPADPDVPPAVSEALARADQIVLGPGSLYTSVLAAAAIPGVRDAVTSSPAQVVYVANLRSQQCETRGYDVAQHVAALARHGIVPDVVIYDPACLGGVGAHPSWAAALSAEPGDVHDATLLGGVLGEVWASRGQAYRPPTGAR